MKNKILLSYGRPGPSFEVEELIQYFRAQHTDHLIIGTIHVTLLNHKIQHSLDVWIRRHHNVKSKHKDTCQATTEVINQLIKFKQFFLWVIVNDLPLIACVNL
jgi:hypothetical protein